MPKSLSTRPITRRSFAVGAATATAAALLPVSETYGQTTTSSQSEAAAMAKLSSGARAEVKAKVGELFRKYGSRLSDEQKADIRKIMAETQDGLEKMRAFALTNADQPATVYKLYEGEGTGTRTTTRTKPHA